MLSEPGIAAEIAGRFDHLLVDEYQDTNALQAEIVLALRPGGAGLTVVGDDAQSIYSFRAATVRNILDFPKHFEPPARVVTLDRNYRSTQAILAAANAVIALAPERFAKDLWTDRKEGRRRRARHRRRGGRSGALCRDRGARQPGSRRGAEVAGGAVPRLDHSAALELELTRRNIPFVKFGGLKFLDAAHVKDALVADALRREPARPRRGISRRPAPARRRAEDRRGDPAAAEDDGFAAMSALASAGQGASRLRRLRRPSAAPRFARGALAGRTRRRGRLARAYDRDALRRLGRRGSATSRRLSASPARSPRASDF